MSHFTRIKTQMVEREYLKRAIEDLGYRYEEGKLTIRGFRGRLAHVEIKLCTERGYDIGFRKRSGTYQIVADWWGVRGIKRKDLQQLVQRYAYHAALDRLKAKGFDLVSEEVQEGDRIHMVLRRMA